MPGLIDNGGTTGLAFTVSTGLQWEEEIGGAGFILIPEVGASGAVLMETSGFVLMEDGVSLILME